MIEDIITRNNFFKLLPNNSIGAELGVLHGVNAISLYHTIKPKKMYLVDKWEFRQFPIMSWGDYYLEVEQKFAYEVEKGIVELVRQDDIKWLSSLENNHLDWLYLDTAHTYEQTVAEINAALPKIKKGGAFGFHDFYVTPKGWQAGVIRAVLESCQRNELKMVAITGHESFTSVFCEVME